MYFVKSWKKKSHLYKNSYSFLETAATKNHLYKDNLYQQNGV